MKKIKTILMGTSEFAERIFRNKYSELIELGIKIIAIITMPDKAGDFIRSMPTGVGLLSDQKTQNRSLVVKIRPRISLHAGREAVPKSLRSKMRDQKQATVPALDKRDVRSLLDSEII